MRFNDLTLHFCTRVVYKKCYCTSYHKDIVRRYLCKNQVYDHYQCYDYIEYKEFRSCKLILFIICYGFIFNSAILDLFC